MQPGTRIVTETRSGLMRGIYQGRRGRGLADVEALSTGRVYVIRESRCVEVPDGAEPADIPALYVSKVYTFVPREHSVLCCHPDDSTRSYEMEQDLDGDWSCTCKSWEHNSLHGEKSCKHLKGLSLVNDRVDALRERLLPGNELPEELAAASGW